MIKIAVYGKGGIGKSTTVSNVAAALAEMGLTVMQIGCDPKADSTIQLRHGEAVPTVLDLYNEKKQTLELEDMIRIGYNGVICVEAGGPDTRTWMCRPWDYHSSGKIKRDGGV